MEIDRIAVAPHVQGLIAPYLKEMAEAKAKYDANETLVGTILAAAHIEFLHGWGYDKGYLIAPQKEQTNVTTTPAVERSGMEGTPGGSGTAVVQAGPGTRPNNVFLMGPGGGEGDQPKGPRGA